MKRDIYAQLLVWKNKPKRKSLILKGARQVGKTFIIKKFAETEYQNYIYINFDENRVIHKLFEENISVKKIINDLSLLNSAIIEPQKTLIIFDEIQECPNALNSLKYFTENEVDYHVIAAGSLLGVWLNNSRGFPVGKVNFLELYPLNFFEFLEAINRLDLRNYLESINHAKPLSEPIHLELQRYLKEYLYVGGMPSVVNQYIESSNKYQDVRIEQNEILAGYEHDFSKYTDKFEAIKISKIWNSLVAQLTKENKKFIFSVLRKGTRAKDYEYSLEWLINAGLVYKIQNISNPKYPLDAFATSNIFKLYFVDVGLLGAKCNLSAKTIIDGNSLFESFKGAIIENYVLQELIKKLGKSIYYWTSEGEAEVDFLLSHNENSYPLEVKAGISKKKKSLAIYGMKYSPPILSRTTSMNLIKDGNILNYPLYLINLFPEIH